MISLHCTQCKQLLEMDEAFAGGVCRCQYCGTIQTVPSKKKSKTTSATSKALYKKGSSSGSVAGAPAEQGTGLDELAEIVASSGLARGSLSKPPTQVEGEIPTARAPVAKQKQKKNAMMPMLIGAGVVIVILVGVVIYMATRPPSHGPDNVAKPQATDGGIDSSSTPDHSSTPEKPVPPPVPVGPSFAGVSLPSGNVAFLLDRSQANDLILDAAKAAAYRAVRSLGPDRKFQIIFWHRQDEGIVAFPDDGMAPATGDNVDAAFKRFEDVVSYGTTDLKPTIQKALKSNPSTVVILTAKGFNLEESDVAAVEAAVKDHPVKIDTFSIGEAESVVLKQIAEKTGGEYHELSDKKLRSIAQ
jgi:hypothetical protein